MLINTVRTDGDVKHAALISAQPEQLQDGLQNTAIATNASAITAETTEELMEMLPMASLQ
jgi:hypothetical protein